MVHLIVQLLVFILILIVSHRNLYVLHFLIYDLDTFHGPRTANIMSRHVGDLGNLTTDASGAVNVDI